MEIIDNKAVKFCVKDYKRITSVIPKSKYLGEKSPGVHEVLVHFGLDEAQVLKNLKLKGVRSPIAFNYTWPGMYTPFDHQRATAEFLTLHKRCYCLNEAGTGKTGAALWAIDYLIQTKKIKRALVICPVSIMRAAWAADAFKCVMHLRVEIAHGTKAQRMKAINSGAEIVILNYDGVPTVIEEMKSQFDLIVLDEATFIKTATTRRWKSLAKVVTTDTWLWLMTGTPAAQSPLDAYGLAKLCTPARVPSFFGAWRDATMVKVGLFRWMPSPKATTLVNNALQPAIRFTKEECLDLPEMLYQTRDVPLSKQQEKFYKMLKSKLTVNAAGEQITAVHAASALNKLLQISAGAVYSDTGDIVKFDAGERLSEMLSVIQESSHKTVVFVPFRHAIEITRKYIEDAGISVECIFGDVSISKRTDIFNRFQTTDDPRVLVIQPQSAAHGVTLTAASTIIWFGPTASLETYLQGNARIHRAGQSNKTLVVRLVGSPVERKVYAALDSKELDMKRLMQLYDDVIKGD
jgi:SNF2 family DNA or RNA helicase